MSFAIFIVSSFNLNTLAFSFFIETKYPIKASINMIHITKTIKYVKKLTPSSEALKISFNSWINTLNNEEIKEITILIFKIFYSNNQRNIMNLRGDLIKSAKVYLTSISKEDKQVKNDFHRKISEFIKLYFSNLFDLKKAHIFLRRK